jgi:hypothetical protein
MGASELPNTSNPELYAYALFRLGGSGQFVDIEDVYVECWRLSPERFGWRKHNYPNHEFAATARRDFESAHPDLVLKSADGLGRQLSADGISWIRHRLTALEALVDGGAPTNARRRSHRLISQFTRHEVYRRGLDGKPQAIAKADAADFLNCAPDSAPSVWQRRIAVLRAAAQDVQRPDLLAFLDGIDEAHPDWFDGGDK